MPDGRLSLTFRQPAPGGGLERPALAADRPRGGEPDARRAASASCARCPPRTPGTWSGCAAIAAGLGIDWPADLPYGALVTEPWTATTPRQAAFLNEAGSLFRGAGYTRVRRRPCRSSRPTRRSPRRTRTAPRPCAGWWTAPSRRRASRSRPGGAVPDWTRAALPLLPAAMAEGSRRAGRVERASIDLVEAAVLSRWSGERFDAVVVALDDDGDGGEIVLPDLAVVARCAGRLPLGHRTQVLLEAADPAERRAPLPAASDAPLGRRRRGGSGVSRRWDAGTYDRGVRPAGAHGR